MRKSVAGVIVSILLSVALPAHAQLTTPGNPPTQPTSTETICTAFLRTETIRWSDLSTKPIIVKMFPNWPADRISWRLPPATSPRPKVVEPDCCLMGPCLKPNCGCPSGVCSLCYGHFYCPNCNGINICRKCSGTKQEKCSSCSGDGVCRSCNDPNPCGACKGKGKQHCTECNGKGTRCSNWSYHGRPDICVSGCERFVQCPSCKGAGVFLPSEQCKGSGRYCLKCKNSRKCQDCGAAKPCGNCKGTGTCQNHMVLCPVCQGATPQKCMMCIGACCK